MDDWLPIIGVAHSLTHLRVLNVSDNLLGDVISSKSDVGLISDEHSPPAETESAARRAADRGAGKDLEVINTSGSSDGCAAAGSAVDDTAVSTSEVEPHSISSGQYNLPKTLSALYAANNRIASWATVGWICSTGVSLTDLKIGENPLADAGKAQALWRHVAVVMFLVGLYVVSGR